MWIFPPVWTNQQVHVKFVLKSELENSLSRIGPRSSSTSTFSTITKTFFLVVIIKFVCKEFVKLFQPLCVVPFTLINFVFVNI